MSVWCYPGIGGNEYSGLYRNVLAQHIDSRTSIGQAFACKGLHVNGGPGRLLAMLLGAEKDPLDRSATAEDGARALLTGPAANRSMDTGAAVRVADLLEEGETCQT
jgi:hypothetical protein